jgi:hypothetical protein
MDEQAKARKLKPVVPLFGNFKGPRLPGGKTPKLTPEQKAAAQKAERRTWPS